MVFAIMPLHFIGLLGMPFIHLQAITLASILMAVVSPLPYAHDYGTAGSLPRHRW